MDPSAIFSKYSALTAFFNKYKNVDINDFVAVIEAAHYALRLEGQTLDDINAAQTIHDLYPFAAALDVDSRQEIVNKYNNIFGANEEEKEDVVREVKEKRKLRIIKKNQKQVTTTHEKNY